MPYNFSGVTLLITHYNRSSSLERLLSTFQKLDCRFEDIVVSDDASKPEHLEKVKAMQRIYNYRLITTPVNKGHGNCINKGQDAIKTPYTMYVQEDFVPSAIAPVHLQDALQFMKEDKSLDYIRFWALSDKYPDLKPYGKGFSEMIFRFWNPSHLKFYQYTDTPHIRRNNFFERFGRYKEGLHGDVIDYKMAISFLQHKGKGLFYEDFSSLFLHENSHEEPSMIRGEATNWRHSNEMHIRFLRWMYLRYRWIKYTWELKFVH